MRTERVDLRRGRRPLLGGTGGFSLVEMMVAIAVSAIVALGLYAYYTSQQRSSLSQKIGQDLRNDCNFAMDKMKGDLLLAGYRSVDPEKPVTVATSSEITFDFWDDHASTDPPFDAAGYSSNTQVTYKVVGGDLQRLVRRYYVDTITPANSGYKPTNPIPEVLAKNIQNPTSIFNYLASNNGAWTPTYTGADLNNGVDIRTINFSLQCRSPKALPVSTATGTAPRYPEITLTSQVRARNIGVSETAQDTTPPGVPQNPVSWDPGECGKLELAWDANTDSDLAGYTLFYGLASNSYSNRVRISAGPKASGELETYTLKGLDSTTSVCGAGTPSPVQYYFKVSAFDKSGNPSALSAEAYGNPGISTRSYDDIATGPATGIDSTIHPAAPPAPVLTETTAADAYNKVVLSWTKPTVDGHVVEGLKGYRLYRSYTPGFTPVGRRVTDPGNNLVKDDTFLTKDVLTYTDENLEGCRYVYYRIAAVACDECLTPQTYSPEFAAYPHDNDPPPPPEIEAKDGYRRIILNIKNPQRATTSDFVHTKIWFREGTVAPPHLDSTDETTSTDGTLIPDSVGNPKPTRGIVTADGDVAINFDSTSLEIPGPPSLKKDTTYSFLAVAYDRCGLHSDPNDAHATAVGDQCGDGPAGPPSAATGIDAEGCLDPVNLTWNPVDLITNGDFYGYHIYRCNKSLGYDCTTPCVKTTAGNEPYPGWVEQTGAYIWDANYDDTASKGLLPGGSFAYCIQTTDCYYEEHRLTWPDLDINPDLSNDPKDNFRETVITKPVAVGVVELDPTRTAVVTGVTASGTDLPPAASFQHNTVLFWTQNTAMSGLSLRTLNLTWENPLAYLQKVVIDTAATPDWEDTSGTPSPGLSTMSGNSVTLGANSKFLSLDTQVPFDLTFKSQTGTVTKDTDMRQNQMDFILTYKNESTDTEGCATVQTDFYAPLGPYVYGTSQNLPMAGTLSWAVPGDNGTNQKDAVSVPGLTGVTVYTNVYDSSLKGIKSVKLFYYVDAGQTLSAAPKTNGTYPDFTPDGYQSIDMERVAGQQWRTPALQPDGTTFGGIPDTNGANVWFFIVAVDFEGNFDREPEPASGAFQYFQQKGDVCLNKPNPPHILTLGDPLMPAGGSASSYTSTGVTLHWTPPTTNAVTDSPLNDLKGYYVYRSGTTAPIATIDIAALTDPDLPAFSETPPYYTSETYTYTVTAYDECTKPGPRESISSNPFTECMGATGCSITLVKNQSRPDMFQPGDSFKIELFACDLIDGKVSTLPGGGNAIYAQTCSTGVTDADVILLDEVGGDTGRFRIRAPISSPLQPLEEILTHNCSTGQCTYSNETDLAVRPNDTITVKGWFDSANRPGSNFGDCALSSACSASIDVTTYSDPCVGIADATVPSNLKVTVPAAQCSANPETAETVSLTWDGDLPGSGLFYRIYRCTNASNVAACTIATSDKIFPTGVEPDTTQTSRSFTDNPGIKAVGNQIWYKVEAVRHNGCNDTSLWKKAITSTAVKDDCLKNGK